MMRDILLYNKTDFFDTLGDINSPHLDQKLFNKMVLKIFCYKLAYIEIVSNEEGEG
jgi:hypothetical protein